MFPELLPGPVQSLKFTQGVSGWRSTQIRQYCCSRTANEPWWHWVCRIRNGTFPDKL